jgi:perosamine synthetase
MKNKKNESPIGVNEPLFISDEKKYLAQCIDTGWVSSLGPFVKEFEEKISSFVGTKYGIAVTSGTAALEIAMGTIGIKPGDEVIMPTFTIISCPNAVLTYGGVPVFVDSEPETWNIDVQKIEEKITKKTKAIMPVHIYGHPCDMDTIGKLAKKYNLKIIEDVAESLGAEYKNKKLGTLGDISCFSFFNKIINTGEGGMLLTNNSEYVEKIKILRNLGHSRDRKYYHCNFARNYRMTNLQAALGVAQCMNVEKFLEIKRKNAKKYTKELKGLKGIQLPVEKEWAKSIFCMYGIVLDESTDFTAESFASELAKEGIETRQFFYPMHWQPILKELNVLKAEDEYPLAERISKQGLYLPCGLGLKDWQIEKITKTIKKLIN